MLDPASAFSLAGLLAILGWLALLVALFVAAARPWAIGAARFAVPALLAIAYALLIAEGMQAGTGGGFGSIQEVRALFSNDAALAAGWLHYLAFDLFVGAWITEDRVGSRVPALLVIPCLVLTFLTGPVGLLLYLLLRLAFRSRAAGEAAQ